MRNHFRLFSRRALSLLLALLFCASGFPVKGPGALAEEASGEGIPGAAVPGVVFGALSVFDGATETAAVTGYTFTLKPSLEIQDVQPTARARMKGYADLLDAISLRGSFCAWPERKYFDLRLEIIPEEKNAEPVSLRFYNTQTRLMMTSPLLGDRPVLFSTDNLLAFAFKTYEHLGLNLHYPVLLLPCAYDFAFRYVLLLWDEYIASPRKTHTVSSDTLRSYADTLAGFLGEDGSNLSALVKVLGICEGYDENVEAEIMNMPSYLLDTAAHGGKLKYVLKKGSEEWISGKETLYTRTFSDGSETISLNLPATENGFRPSLSLSSVTREDRISSELSFGWLSGDPDLAEDIFSVSLSAKDLPARWPMACSGGAELSLTGSLFPMLRVGASLNSDEQGNLELKIKNAAGSYLAGGTVLTLTGTVLPSEFTVQTCSGTEVRSAVDILVSNDVTLNAWIRGIMPIAASRILNFLAVVPASTYQSILDDLTETGVLSLLFGVD